MSQVDIGIIEPCDSWRLKSRFFPSKVGGKPAWLDLKNILTYNDLKCEYCAKPCIFLCQIYAPYEERDETFHRTIFIFICLNIECCKANQNGNLKVFRSQLPRENEFFPPDPPIEEESWRADINAEKYVKTCYVCGILAPSHCAKCKKINYCCRDHQLLDWKENHKKICLIEEPLKNNNYLFPEYELVVVTDDNNSDNSTKFNELQKEQNELKILESLIQNGKAGTMQSEENIDEDLLKMAHETEDKIFAKFKDEVKKYPDQVSRYDRGGSPLYISPKNKVLTIPRCENCGGERQFELQIMPQLINYLHFKDAFNSLDWGVLLIFSCKSSCKLSSAYAKEYIWKQDICESNKQMFD